MSNALEAAAEKARRATGLSPTDLAKIEGVVGRDKARHLFAAVGSAMDSDGVLSPVEARARIDQVKRDPAWYARFERGESAERNEWAKLQAIMALGVAADGRPVPEYSEHAKLAPNARARMEHLKADPDFRARYIAGDADALNEFAVTVDVAVADGGPAV